MKLDEFLKVPSFSKYQKEVFKFKDEFIAEGCETFLWTSYTEEMKARQFTSELAAKKGKINTNLYISNFIKQISDIDENLIVFIFPENYSPKYLMAKEISKTAKHTYIIKNIFKEDDTINWISIFDPADEKSIGMMFHILYSNIAFTGDQFGGYKLFGKGLMYYADCLEFDGQLIKPIWTESDRLGHFQGNMFRRDTNPLIILESRKISKMLIRLGYFNDEYELLYNLWEILLPALQKMYEKVKDYLKDKHKDWKSYVKSLYSQMVANGAIVSKWKSEQTLFTLVKKEYPDALFQFRPSWLEPQNLDIYIPRLNVGIEYQGIQHYECIDFFGGEEAFQHRKNLDARKETLCKTNGLKLILWPYTDEISIKNLKSKIMEVKD